MSLAWVSGFGVSVTDTRTVLGTHPDAAPKQVSRTKMSLKPPAGSLSPGTRFDDNEENATNLPSALMDWSELPLLPIEPSLPSETRLALGVHRASTPAHVSRTYTLAQIPTFAETRFEANVEKATSRPSELIDGTMLKVSELFAAVPSRATSTLVVLGVHGAGAVTQVSRTNMLGSTEGLLFGAMLLAQDTKATKRPTASIAVRPLVPFPCAPEDDTETRVLLGLQPADVPKQVSRTNASSTPLVSTFTMFVTFDVNATNSSPLLIEGFAPPAGFPSTATETKVVLGTQLAAVPLHVSRRKTQVLPHTAVPGSMFVAWESNATKRPSLLIAESRLWPFVGEPSWVVEIRVVLGVQLGSAEPRHGSRR